MGKVRGRRGQKAAETADKTAAGSRSPSPANEKEGSARSDTQAFFGLVDSAELTYFHQAEQTLGLDTFGSPEEREMFVQGVFEEARGKELKLATNQICSKLLERLIHCSSRDNVSQLAQAFQGRFVDLARQKYSSHVIEAYVVRLAALVEEDLVEGGAEGAAHEGPAEALFGVLMGEITARAKVLMNDKYASHVLRLVMLVLGGKELPSGVAANSILRSKKSKIARKMIDIKDSENYKRQFQTPAGFRTMLKPLVDALYEGEDTKTLRELAIAPVTSPCIQLAIQLEGLVDKSKPFWTTIFNGDKAEEAFVEYALSDPVGSHFLEAAIQQQKLKNVERLYTLYMKDRIVRLAKRETTGVYVVEAMMAKLKVREQQEMLHELVPVLNELMVNNLDVGAKIIQCSQANEDFLKTEIVAKLLDFFNKGTEGDLLENVLRYKSSTLFATKDDWPTSEERRRALFLETLLEYDQAILKTCAECFMDLPTDTLCKFALHSVFSHILEKVLALGATQLSVVDKKGLLNQLVGLTPTLACNATGSHIVDALWPFTLGQTLFKERIARALFDNRDQIKSTLYGKMVWKNWAMELYARKFNDWKRQVKDEEYAAKNAAKDAANAPQTPNTNSAQVNHSDSKRRQKAPQRGEFKRPKRY